MLFSSFSSSQRQGNVSSVRTLLPGICATALFSLLLCLQVSGKGSTIPITLSEKNVPLQKVFKEIQKQTGYDFLCTYELLEKAGKVSVQVKNATLEQALESCLKGTDLTYLILDKTIVIKQRVKSPNELAAVDENLPPPIDISGKVTDDQGNPLTGASVKIKGTNIGTTTDANGLFTLKNVNENAAIEISFVGFQPQTVTAKENGLM